ncbi:MobF family relaxase [Geodermatophilus normandii]|uniref:Relaxase domain-containing protein n=1 Tax=Geodermatophilus normandii TaxID=1137989 RepID=A0A6P0GBA0_9ACTN|nr:MobF family relaxase [Geodermatophilus normandii]NEM05178.1 relaxase domain-containing protein [Geodermatophilus normandii]
MKVYAGSPTAARQYLEADRGRADDYYLAEGTGVARRLVARDGRVAELESLTGADYEAWVAGQEPGTGEPRGRLRTDGRAVRFVEVVVNGPKSWSLAAALHPDIAAAYDAAQDHAAVQIIGWLGRHATTRVGPRGGQVQVPVEVLEAVTVRHHTSRAGDPHRHLHLQLNARVFAAGRWRGLHTVGVRDFLSAINGIGHAAVATDPRFRAALAAHGYTVDAAGEVHELADYVGPFSARAAQIERNLERYERNWRSAHPDRSPGPALWRAWDARAWADGRPDKVTPRPGAELTARWLAELAALGYRDPDRPVQLVPLPVGALDRECAVDRLLTRLASGRSAWNAADLRGDAERLIAEAGIVAEAAVCTELAEDLTARAMACCVPLLALEGIPEHIRAWTSPAVLDVEADLTARLAARGAHHGPAGDREPALVAGLERLDAGQTATAAALAGERPLVVVEGAAGAGKTTTLAATRHLLALQGRGLLVVTPTLKAARVASTEVGAVAGSAAWLTFQHGWRWAGDGAWNRLAAGQADPATGIAHAGPEAAARLRPGDLLVVDEAGMLDQDTARALLTIADECGAGVALLGDRHQLAAVGRGGVLDLAVRAADPAACLTLDVVHRFVRTGEAGRTVPDTEYAELTLAMRRGDDPGAVFDALHARGQIRLHADASARLEALTGLATASSSGGAVAVVVDTREQADVLNAVIRDRLVAEGRVDDVEAVATRAGQRIGAGDQIATRRNDRTLGVANRDTWTVTAVGPHGELTVIPAPPGARIPAGDAHSRAGERVLPANYVACHVELAYASTAYGVQGETVAVSHMVIGEHTGAASAYVGMTRGRTTNTAHLVAVDLDEAREHWIAVWARDRADLGPGHAADIAAREAARYAPGRPLALVLADLHRAWTTEQRFLDRLALQQPLRDALRTRVEVDADLADALTAADTVHRRAARDADRARQRADTSDSVLAAATEHLRADLLARWDADRDTAARAAAVVLAGPGRLGLRRAAVARAGQTLTAWADTWRPYLPGLPADPGRIAQIAGKADDRPVVEAALGAVARRAAETERPAHAAARAAADAIQRAAEQARQAVDVVQRQYGDRLAGLGAAARIDDPAEHLTRIERDIAAARQQLTEARAHIAGLRAEPALLAQPPGRLDDERAAWRVRHSLDRRPGPPGWHPMAPPLSEEPPAQRRSGAPAPGR